MGLCCSKSDESHLKQFVSSNGLSVCILTWNVNAKQPSDSFEQLLNHNNMCFDIYVVGLQEIVDLNAKNLIINNDANVVWENKIESTLNNPINSKKSKNNKHKYMKLRSIGLVGILLMIYVKDTIFREIQDIMSSKCGSGLFDIAGNKGGVGIRFNIFDTSICFICCHLAAHKNNIKGRNEDYHKIIQKLTFIPDDKVIVEMNDDEKSMFEPSTSPSLTLKATNSGNDINEINNKKHKKTSSLNGISILQHDIVYFLGDINYRLEFDNLEEVYTLIENKKWNHLLSKDQLLQQIENGYAFADFNEQKISFQPTFKYEIGTNKYEQVKKRIPSYCDRILWKIKKNNHDKQKNINCIRYNCCLDEKMSDHKPVYGLFQIQY